MNKPISIKSEWNWGHPLQWCCVVAIVVTFTLLIWIGEHKNDGKPTVLIVYAFSTQKEVLTQGIFPAFEQFWESETGEAVDIEGIFGPSGNLSAQITLGAPADVAIFSNQRHIDWLKLGKCVDKDTNAVLFASTPMVILTRPGNPAGILDYADLVQPGIQLLHADPSSSGAGEWVVLAEYGSVYLKTGDPDTAKSQLKNIWRNVRLMGSSARTTLTLFEMGVGDALVTYEQDAFFALQRGVAMEIIHPQSTILARHFAVIVDKNVSFVKRPVVEAFLAYIQSDEGQQIFKQYYFRSSTLKSDLLPALDQTFTEEDLGGWTNAYDLLIEKTWKTEIKPDLQMEPVTAYLGGGE